MTSFWCRRLLTTDLDLLGVVGLVQTLEACGSLGLHNELVQGDEVLPERLVVVGH